MKTVAPPTQYYERLLAKLNEQESSIEASAEGAGRDAGNTRDALRQAAGGVSEQHGRMKRLAWKAILGRRRFAQDLSG